MLKKSKHKRLKNKIKRHLPHWKYEFLVFAERAGRENHSNSEAQFEAEDKTAGNDNPNHHDDEPPNYQVISDTDLKSNGKKADKDTPV